MTATKPQQAWAAVEPNGEIRVNWISTDEARIIWMIMKSTGSADWQSLGWRIIRVTITPEEETTC